MAFIRLASGKNKLERHGQRESGFRPFLCPPGPPRLLAVSPLQGWQPVGGAVQEGRRTTPSCLFDCHRSRDRLGMGLAGAQGRGQLTCGLQAGHPPPGRCTLCIHNLETPPLTIASSTNSETSAQPTTQPEMQNLEHAIPMTQHSCTPQCPLQDNRLLVLSQKTSYHPAQPSTYDWTVPLLSSGNFFPASGNFICSIGWQHPMLSTSHHGPDC